MARAYEDVYITNRYCQDARVLQLTGEHKRVLEIGCANGRMSKVLVRSFCRVTGIEINTALADCAREYCELVIEGDVENPAILQSVGSDFDRILITDVLEHLVDPKTVLMRLSGHLTLEGRIVVAIPNIAHWSARWALLRGRFDYSDDGGMFDSTHLHFYTLSTARMLFDAAGLEVEHFFPIPWLFRGKRIAKLPFLAHSSIIWNGVLPAAIASVLPASFAISQVYSLRPKLMGLGTNGVDAR